MAHELASAFQQAVRIVQEEHSDDRTRSDEQRLDQLEYEIGNLIESLAKVVSQAAVSSVFLRDRQ